MHAGRGGGWRYRPSDTSGVARRQEIATFIAFDIHREILRKGHSLHGYLAVANSWYDVYC